MRDEKYSYISLLISCNALIWFKIDLMKWEIIKPAETFIHQKNSVSRSTGLEIIMEFRLIESFSPVRCSDSDLYIF